MENRMPDSKVLAENLDKISYTLDKAYIRNLGKCYKVANFSDYQYNCGGMSLENNIRLIKVVRWVKDSEESVVDCFKNMLGLFYASGESNIALVVKRTPKYVDMYFAIRNVGSNLENMGIIGAERDLLISSLKGNFNGSSFKKIDINIYDEIFSKNICSIATTCSIPSEKSENFISQGIEKLLDGVIPSDDSESYTLLILAEPLNEDDVRRIVNGFEEIASALTPFITSQFQHTDNITESEGTNDSIADTNTISTSISKTHSVNINASVGIKAVNIGGGYGYSHGKTSSKSDSNTIAHGTNYMIANGTSSGSTYTYKSYPIANLVDKAEKSIERMNLARSNGLWRYASYVLSESAIVTKNVAGFITALSQGDKSYIEPPNILEWSKTDRNDSDFDEILKYLKHFSHPIFVNKEDKVEVLSTSNVSTSELSNLFAFPRHSVQGLPVIECARFGREPHSLIELKSDLEIGKTYHMHNTESNAVCIDKNSLTSHTFITGSTGSGKSNTVFNIINNATAKGDTKFLIIEPAKGEYKDVFGSRDVAVYGTNPEKTELLRINPFEFPEGILVTEHIDRLIEIFNVCWPMYAAMPAILKDAVVRAYEILGWDLVISKNKYNRKLFPTFNDVLDQVRIVLAESEYSADNKGDYTGALFARIKSLTNGINGMIFTADGLSGEALFEKNVIVDLSRVGSTETKALIMGLLVMKLQEFRMSADTPLNRELKHLTVLEEAHNLLPRTSTEQSSDSSNLLGKSVEMLANAIAEMRAYGEGFIIADQAPDLLDMSVIRNTNTKIIHRLPDLSDRELVGRAIGLNDSQIVELSRLKLGVAAVYQNNWIEAVLCEVNEYNDRGTYKKPVDTKIKNTSNKKSLLDYIVLNELKMEGENIENLIICSKLSASVKCEFLEYVKMRKDPTFKILHNLASDYLMCAIDSKSKQKAFDKIAWASSKIHVDGAENISKLKTEIDIIIELVRIELVQRRVEPDTLFLEIKGVK